MKVAFGDLPLDAQAMLTRHLRVDFTPCDFKAPRWFSACGRNEKGHITGIFTVEFQTWFEGKVTVLVLDPRCLSRRVLRAIFTALFSQAKRLTAEVEPSNYRALRQVQRLGFVHEGWHPLGLEGCRDTIVFGMLKEECPWLPGYVHPGTSLLNVRNRVFVDPIIGGDQRSMPRVGTDQFDLFSGQRGAAVALADTLAFAQIGATGSPAEMVAADAARHPAGMRGVHLGSGHPVRGDADEAVDFTTRPVREVPHLRVAPRIDGKRPEQAIVSSVANSVGEKTFRGHRLSYKEM